MRPSSRSHQELCAGAQSYTDGTQTHPCIDVWEFLMHRSARVREMESSKSSNNNKHTPAARTRQPTSKKDKKESEGTLWLPQAQSDAGRSGPTHEMKGDVISVCGHRMCVFRWQQISVCPEGQEQQAAGRCSWMNECMRLCVKGKDSDTTAPDTWFHVVNRPTLRMHRVER
mmetsp:Transcript_4087/g.10503  ORF Transcript_4087/g.10503 Transcript_4087/m.10503 type:complete len:171 (-) Transcript_4087:1506-2018(-)